MILAARRALLGGELVGPVSVVIEDGVIAAVRHTTGGQPAPVELLAPGFVDLQVNGIDDVDVASAAGAAWERFDELLAEHGVTTWCPTLITAALASYDGALARIDAARARPGTRPAIAGAHLEGPFLGGRLGAHPPEHVRPVDAQWLRDRHRSLAVVTLGAEPPGAAAAIAELAEHGVVAAIGHSAATYEQTEEAVAAGARLVTHLCNGMAPLHHRAPGVIGAALADDRLSVSIIADGVHVHPAVLRVILRAKGAARVCLVTDAVAWRAGAVGALGIAMVDGAPRLPDGTLAGSALTMDGAIRTLVNDAAVPLADALVSASTTPARVLGLGDRGAIEPGRRADLVALDETLAVRGVWIGGERVR